MGTARTKGAVWAWLVVIGCIGFYSIPTGIIGNTSGIFVAPVMDQFGWTQTDTTMYRTIQPLVAAVCAPIAGKLMEKHNPRWILATVSAAFGLAAGVACERVRHRAVAVEPVRRGVRRDVGVLHVPGSPRAHQRMVQEGRRSGHQHYGGGAVHLGGGRKPCRPGADQPGDRCEP